MSINRTLDSIRHVNGSVARRAFELFQSREQKHGGDLDDWLRAESEVLHSTHVDVEDCDEVIVVRAEVPGFRLDELRFCVEPFQITIAGVRETPTRPVLRKMVYSDRCPDQVFRVINCPFELNSSNPRATLKEGILELEIPKARALPLATIAAAAYWILRPEDHRRWASVFQPPFENGNRSKQPQVRIAVSA
jgi:HSP20 family protein